MAEEKKQARVIFHKVFLSSIFLKGVDGALETVGGFLLFLFNHGEINRFVFWLAREELSEDPKDFIANYLVGVAQNFSLDLQLFLSLYLIAHGFIKVILVISLWQKKIWAFPAAIIFLSLFIFYQLYRFSYSHSPWLIWMTIFDILIIFLAQREYKNLKRQRGISLSEEG
ncbi:MAG: DUF2127 domain-containing protein [Patescibacteria group bacterium]|nr:DUF2127 domain-containing protein [Patescibacteria group bacterium]MDD5294946.1 DUF2127 domain-containing protein [Patescibacteria group bacterium]MDD5554784.1 DUF2127 domain-containing protein [Patescibacteria group bacterium]